MVELSCTLAALNKPQFNPGPTLVLLLCILGTALEGHLPTDLCIDRIVILNAPFVSFMRDQVPLRADADKRCEGFTW